MLVTSCNLHTTKAFQLSLLFLHQNLSHLRPQQQLISQSILYSSHGQSLANAPATLPIKQCPIEHSHDGKCPTHRGTHASKEVRPPTTVLLKFHVQRAHFIKEKHTRQSSITARIDMSSMFRYRILKCLNHGTIQETKEGRDYLQIVLEHSIPIGNSSGGTIELAC